MGTRIPRIGEILPHIKTHIADTQPAMDFRPPTTTMSTSTKKAPLFIQNPSTGAVAPLSRGPLKAPSLRGPFEAPRTAGKGRANEAPRSAPFARGVAQNAAVAVPPPAPAPAPFALDPTPPRSVNADARSAAILAAHEAKKKLLGNAGYVSSPRLEQMRHAPTRSQTTSVNTTARSTHTNTTQKQATKQARVDAVKQHKKASNVSNFELDVEDSGINSFLPTESLIIALRDRQIPLEIHSSSTVDSPSVKWTLNNSQEPDVEDLQAMENGLPILCHGLVDTNLRMVSAAQCAALQVIPVMDVNTIRRVLPLLIKSLNDALMSSQQASNFGAAAVLLELLDVDVQLLSSDFLAFVFQLASGLERHLHLSTSTGRKVGQLLHSIEQNGGEGALGSIQDALPTYLSQQNNNQSAKIEVPAVDGGEEILLDDTSIVVDEM